MIDFHTHHQLCKAKLRGRERSGIDTIKYHTWHRTPYGKVTKHKKTQHTREPRCQPFPSRWQQGCKERTRQHNKNKHKNIKNIHKRSTAFEGSAKKPTTYNCLAMYFLSCMTSTNIISCAKLVVFTAYFISMLVNVLPQHTSTTLKSWRCFDAYYIYVLIQVLALLGTLKSGPNVIRHTSYSNHLTLKIGLVINLKCQHLMVFLHLLQRQKCYSERKQLRKIEIAYSQKLRLFVCLIWFFTSHQQSFS